MLLNKNTVLKLSTNCIFQTLDNQKIILNIDSGKYFECNEIGKVIFDILESKENTYAQLLASLKEKYQNEDIESDLEQFINDLVESKILELKKLSFFRSILELTDRQIEDLFDILLFPDNANVQSAFINDTQLWNMARKYQLSGFFLKSLKFNSDSNLKEKLLQLHKNYLIKYMSMKSDLLKVSNNLNKFNIHYVVLKGMALNHMCLYKDLERQSRDIDILIKKEDVKKCYKLLKSMGYKYYFEDTNDSCDYMYDFYHLPPLINENNSVIEVHVKLTKTEFYEQCPIANYALSNFKNIDGLNIPNDELLLAHALYHGFFHHELNEGPVFLIDIKNLIYKLDSNAKIKLNSLLIKLSLDKEYQNFFDFLDSKKVLNKKIASKKSDIKFFSNKQKSLKVFIQKINTQAEKDLHGQVIGTKFLHFQLSI